MCGIAGLLHWGTVADAAARAQTMARSIRHRGPDDEGFWSDGDIALGFTRLSIVDLESGRQPMPNEDRSVWVVFNGEIYNHRELRSELEARGHRFASDHSDTEVLVHGWEEWGERLPQRLNGMFAFAVWDAGRKELFLARDRFGIKPLYTARLDGGTLLFASEIRAIHASALVEAREDCDGILEYFSQQNLWGENTMFAGVEQFPAGTMERVSTGKSHRQRYWDYRFPRSLRMSLADAADAHRAILSRVIERQIAADVPVMAYLSGGIDSSALVAAAHRLDPRVHAYSCLFDLTGVGADRIVDEREFSRAVASYLRIEHVQLELAQDSLARSLDETVRALETPRMGMAYVNYLIAARVAKDSKVVLSGTGGDELHGGYLYRYQAVMPQPRPAPFTRAWVRWLRARAARAQEARSVHFNLLNFPIQWTRLQEAFTTEFLARVRSYEPRSAIDSVLDSCPYDDPLDRMMYVDARTYLHGLLVLEDKLSMAHSLEARVPLLDNELVDFICDLPWTLLCDGETGKIVFRESVRPWVPDVVYRKPKMGFGPPDASWYRGALRGFVERRLSRARIEARGILRPDFIQALLSAHFDGTQNNLPTIWSALSFDSWCDSFGIAGGRLASAA
jgi:asparagine synthase (glutamine-hydrolysing)